MLERANEEEEEEEEEDCASSRPRGENKLKIERRDKKREKRDCPTPPPLKRVSRANRGE